jgi:hypothetical protein
VTFIAAGLLSARMLVLDPANGGAWLVIELLLLLLTLTAVLGYRLRNRGEERRTDHVLLSQCLGLVAVAALALSGMLLD